MKNLRKKIRESIRNVLREINPDQRVIDDILDKINKKGKDSLSRTEKEYIDQASTGDVSQEIQDEIREKNEVDQEILQKLENDDLLIPTPKLRKASQEVFDKYVTKKIERGLYIPPEEFEMASEEVVDRHVERKIRTRSKVIPKVLEMASQKMRDKYIMDLLKSGRGYTLIANKEILDLASNELQDEIKQYF